MTDKTAKDRPTFKGLRWYREQYFSFFIPIGWHHFNWQDDRQGALFGPLADDAHTVFAADLRDIGFTVTAADLDDLFDGFMGGIQQLPGVEIESSNKRVVGDLITLEAKYTFMDDEMTRKRWVRVLYHRTRQIAFTAQGATPDAYDYWLPMFFEAMMTAKVHSTIPADPYS
jgi:hypothetical protein